MNWNDIDYEVQTIVLNKIASLVHKEKDFELRQGIVSALNELDLWSNSPCQEIDYSGAVQAQEISDLDG